MTGRVCSGICSCLNRTSVGLKHTGVQLFFSPSPEPQSNQRGIETEAKRALDAVGGDGLNRTSVGLKHVLYAPASGTVSRSLNRTSVGLKLDAGAHFCQRR